MLGCLADWMLGCSDAWPLGCLDSWMLEFATRMLGCVADWMLGYPDAGVGCPDAWLTGCADAWLTGCLAARGPDWLDAFAIDQTASFRRHPCTVVWIDLSIAHPTWVLADQMFGLGCWMLG